MSALPFDAIPAAKTPTPPFPQRAGSVQSRFKDFKRRISWDQFRPRLRIIVLPSSFRRGISGMPQLAALGRTNTHEMLGIQTACSQTYNSLMLLGPNSTKHAAKASWSTSVMPQKRRSLVAAHPSNQQQTWRGSVSIGDGSVSIDDARGTAAAVSIAAGCVAIPASRCIQPYRPYTWNETRAGREGTSGS